MFCLFLLKEERHISYLKLCNDFKATLNLEVNPQEKKMEKEKIPKEIRKKLTERDVEVLSKALENVTVTQSGMLRTSNFFIPNPKFDKEFSEGMRAIQQMPEIFKQLLQTMTKMSLDVTEIKQKIS